MPSGLCFAQATASATIEWSANRWDRHTKSGNSSASPSSTAPPTAEAKRHQTNAYADDGKHRWGHCERVAAVIGIEQQPTIDDGSIILCRRDPLLPVRLPDEALDCGGTIIGGDNGGEVSASEKGTETEDASH